MIRCILLYPQVPMEISYLRQLGRNLSETITITAASDEKMYDGTPLTNNGYTYHVRCILEIN